MVIKTMIIICIIRDITMVINITWIKIICYRNYQEKTSGRVSTHSMDSSICLAKVKYNKCIYTFLTPVLTHPLNYI